jgi:hypothetical protein
MEKGKEVDNFMQRRKTKRMKTVCKDCYYAGFDKCQHVKEKLTKKQK